MNQALQDFLQPTFMMCRPSHFNPRKDDHTKRHGTVGNGHMTSNDYDPKKAMQEWETGYGLLSRLGCRIIEPDLIEDAWDQIYTADPGLFLHDIRFSQIDPHVIEKIHSVYIGSNFKNKGRFPELGAHFKAAVNYIHALSQSLGKVHTHKLHIMSSPWEACGDNVYAPAFDRFFSGWCPPSADVTKGRSCIESHKELYEHTLVPVVSLRVRNGGYHIDLTVGPLRRGHIVVSKHGLTEDAYQNLLDETCGYFGLSEKEYIIYIDPKDAAAGAANIIYQDRNDNIVVSDRVSKKYIKAVERRGYKLHLLPVSELSKGGGFWHCMTNPMNAIRVPGGLLKNPNFFENLQHARLG